MKKRTKEILDILDEQYGTEFICYLNYETPWQLLIATMLSAQCTDARVNIVTKDLFQKYTSVDAFANADLKELEQDIKPTGFYHNKAKNIIACMKDVRDKFGGQVPRSLEDLTSLAGVGRKTANVIRGNISEIKALAVGTETTKGVDADVADAVTEDNLSEAVEFVKSFARREGCVAAVTGAIDLVSDGQRCFVIRNGRPEMGRITGTGCQLSAVMTAFITANRREEVLESAAAAVCAMGLAGEIGFFRLSPGEGNATYRNRIIDALYHMDGDQLEKGARYEIR